MHLGKVFLHKNRTPKLVKFLTAQREHKLDTHVDYLAFLSVSVCGAVSSCSFNHLAIDSVSVWTVISRLICRHLSMWVVGRSWFLLDHLAVSPPHVSVITHSYHAVSLADWFPNGMNESVVMHGGVWSMIFEIMPYLPPHPLVLHVFQTYCPARHSRNVTLAFLVCFAFCRRSCWCCSSARSM